MTVMAMPVTVNRGTTARPRSPSMGYQWLPLSDDARFAWDDDVLLVSHRRPDATGAECIMVVPHAVGHIKGGYPVTLDLPVHCVACGVRARIVEGEWVVIAEVSHG